MTRKRWSELSGRQQAAIVAAAVVQQSLAVATLWDLRRRPSAQIRGHSGPGSWTRRRSPASSGSPARRGPSTEALVRARF